MRARSTRRWTRAEYDELIQRGEVTPDDKVELLEGEIVPMAPQDYLHGIAVELADGVFRFAFGPGFRIRLQLPLALGLISEPEPDLAVVPGSPRDSLRSREHPSEAVLVVEVSDSSLLHDRRRKARMYAAARIPDDWIVNLPDRAIEVQREPRASGPNGEWRYQVRLVFRPGDIRTPLAAPHARIALDDLLP